MAAELIDIPLVGNEVVPEELTARIRALKASLGGRVTILGHHYQRDEVIAFADLRGDSLDLARKAAALRGTEFVVFCGVHFMAETADILTPPEVQVILPDMRAGCSMADMADIGQVEEAWEVLGEATSARFVPITYINSTAALKAFCGRNGGACCTSTNARAIVEWAFAQGEKLLFFPDQHLGRNTCAAMGIGLDEMVVYDPLAEDGGNAPEAYARARVVLWKGHCSVHQNFLPNHPDIWRARDSQIQIIVHPECRHEVVRKADFVGSTNMILRTIAESAPGTRWAVGTEHHLVNRLRQEHPDKFVTSLAPFACQCSTMFRISAEALGAALQSIADGAPINVIRVDEETRRWATVSLDRMMERG
jgi:quinolinate synthase